MTPKPPAKKMASYDVTSQFASFLDVTVSALSFSSFQNFMHASSSLEASMELGSHVDVPVIEQNSTSIPASVKT
jgi:hypothetical protein